MALLLRVGFLGILLALWGTEALGVEFSFKFKGLSFISPDEGWLNAGPTILHTQDGGRTWTLQRLPEVDPSRTHWAKQLQFLDPRHGWVLLDGGSFFRTSNGGARWEGIDIPLARPGRSSEAAGLRAFHMVSLQIGVALTADESLLLRTTDGWRTWATRRIRRWQAAFDQVTFLDADRGWATGGGAVYETRDGGRMWRFRGHAPGWGPLQFLSATEWWALKEETGTLFRTGDAGENWQACGGTDPPLRVKAFTVLSAAEGWAAGPGGLVLRTTDGCATWAMVHTPAVWTVRALRFLDAQHGWAAGEADTVLKTRDAGLTWELVPVPPTPDAAKLFEVLPQGLFFGEEVGDGEPATRARLGFPSGLALDVGGTLFIADTQNNRVRRVAPETGRIDTVAGSGPTGAQKGAVTGDGGPATTARLDAPIAVALDRSGNLLIAHALSGRIRRVAAGSGTITTIAGLGVRGFSGDGGPAVRAQFNLPSALAVDPQGQLYVADTENHRVRRIDAVTGIVTTIAGTGVRGFSGDGGPAVAAQFNSPNGLAVDSRGYLFVADSQNHRVRRIDAVTGIVTTIAGTGTRGAAGDGGPAVAAQLSAPVGLAVDASDNLFVAEVEGQRIRKIAASDTTTVTVAGTGVYGFSGDGGPATQAQLRSPVAVAVDASGTLYVLDHSNNRIRKVAAGSGTITTVVGRGHP